MEDMFEYFRDINRHHESQDEDFRKLLVEPSAKTPSLGDHVIVATGFLGMGFNWIREEAVVLECGDTSYKVQFTDCKHIVDGTPTVKWVHQALITDVLTSKE